MTGNLTFTRLFVWYKRVGVIPDHPLPASFPTDEDGFCSCLKDQTSCQVPSDCKRSGFLMAGGRRCVKTTPSTMPSMASMAMQHLMLLFFFCSLPARSLVRALFLVAVVSCYYLFSFLLMHGLVRELRVLQIDIP